MFPLFTTILPLVTDQSIPLDESIRIQTVCMMGEDLPLTGAKLSFLDRQMKWDSAAAIEDTAAEIEASSKLEVLELRGNTLGVEAGERLARALERKSGLKRCLWSDIFTGRLKTEIPPILKSLCHAMISANARLVELDLSDNAFGPVGAEGIQDFLVSPAAYSLEVLKLNNNGLGAGGKVIARCLDECYENAKADGCYFKLKTFIAGRNRLEDPGAIALSRAFKKIGSLEHIAVPQNGIRAEGIEALADAFSANRNLKIININDNTCTAIGGLAVAYAISDLTHLEVLDLGDCLCRDKGGIAIISAIHNGYHPDLRVVDLSGNELTSKTGYLAIEAWDTAGISAELKLSTNNFGGELKELQDCLTESSADELRHISFGTESDDEGTLSEKSGIDYDDDSDEDDYDNEGNSVDEEEEEHVEADAVDQLLAGVGCMKFAEHEEVPSLPTATATETVSDVDARLTFLDQQFKWNSRADVEAAARQIEAHRVLRTLELRGNTLGIQAGERIAEALKQHPELERCLWSDLFTGRLKTEIPPILRSLCGAMISANAHIVELDLSDNAFGPIGAEGIQDFLTSPSAFSLQTLKLNNNGLGGGGKVIAECLLQCHERSVLAGRPLQLKTFVAGRNRLENPGATALANAFTAIGTLEDVTMHQNGITAKGVAALAAAFKVNRNLRVIDLSDNTATEEGSRAIANAVPSLFKLESLLLGDCLCRDAGCHAIIDALTPFTHQKLKVVNLSGAEMSGAAALQIGAKFRKFNGKATLKIESNNFGHMYEEVREGVPDYVDCGDSEDDQGSLSDDEEYQSGSDSGSRSDDEEEVEEHADKENSNDAFSAALSTLDNLASEFDSRTQEQTAVFILNLVDTIAKNNGSEAVVRRAIELAEDVVVRVEASLRRPVPPSTQLVNQLISQAGFIKPESKLVPFAVDRVALKTLFDGLIEKGRLLKEKDTIKFYYKEGPPSVSVFGTPFASARTTLFGNNTAPSKNPPSFSFTVPNS